MKELLPDGNYVDNDGDIRSPFDLADSPQDKVVLDDSAQQLRDALEEREQDSIEKPPIEVLNTIHEYALKEDRLRGFGAGPGRIKAVAHSPLTREIARLFLQDHDTKLAFPPKDQEVSAALPLGEKQPSHEQPITDAQEREIDKLTTYQGMTRGEAERQVLGNSRFS